MCEIQSRIPNAEAYKSITILEHSPNKDDITATTYYYNKNELD